MDKDFFGKDKSLHFIVCLLLSLYSTECAISAALAKEYSDSHASGNHWCWWDLLADILGIITGSVIRVLISHRWNWFY